MSPMKLLILSDLHLDHHPLHMTRHDGIRIDAEADVVILAGDIDEGLKGLRWAKETFGEKPVIYVAGNHEFYSRDWSKHLRDMRVLAAELGIHFLEREAVEIDGVRFLGCSLWTDFQVNGKDEAQECMREAQHRMTDYKRIKFSRTSGTADFYWVRSKTVVPALTQRRHRESVEWLQEQFTRGSAENTVVITHHAPHPRSIPRGFVGHPLTPSYASNLEHLMGNAALWIHGHMHENSDYCVNGTRVVCNPRGYTFGAPPRGENDTFSASFIVKVDREDCTKQLETTP
ncbi:metallophosphoesterase [Acidovorax kalamii]|uniref:metallophosphoesterase n=1 Tax=Acidovorax kalamii TaxID=2004485 RepID=UPI002090E91A|nr:metallophosphoesterase [Acidovorax kalamii]MCO5358627.1 metallophosphoesterase [Acidovorax kalamii]